MKYNQLGNTGLFVSEICLGTMTFTGDNKPGGIWAGIGDVNQKLATEIVGRSVEAGVNFLDTADVYSARTVGAAHRPGDQGSGAQALRRW